MTNRQLAAMETRKKLIAAGKKIICEKGLVNTSIDEITEACGVSKGTFYTYFKRKEDIVFELSSEVFSEILENAKAFEGSFLEKLANYMVCFSEYIEKSSVKLAQDWIRNVVRPEFAQSSDEKSKLQMDLEAVERLTSLGVENNELQPETPVEMLSHTIVDLLYGELLCWCISDGAYSLKERTQEFCETYLSKLIKPYMILKGM